MLDGSEHQITNVIAADTAGAGEETHGLAITAIEREGDAHPFTVVAEPSMEALAAAAELHARSRAGQPPWQLANHVAIEELEAWYFGDWAAVCSAYPRVSTAIPSKRGFRDPDAIRGGTWEAFVRILQRHGYFETGLRKIEAARAIGAHVDPGRNRSRSFVRFHRVIGEATA
jgi:hypothetical protein